MNELPIKIEAIVYALKDNEVQYLIIKRTPEDGYFWQPVTGTVHDGEKLLDCLTREMSEETGLTDLIEVSGCLHTFDWRKSSGQCILEFVYAVQVSPDSNVVLNPEEHEDYKWCTYEQAQEILHTDNNKNAFKIINEYLTTKQ